AKMPTPRYDPKSSGEDDKEPARPGEQEERRGPFSVGVAIEGVVPSFWYGDKETKPDPLPVSPLVGIGHAGIFNGSTRGRAPQQLLLLTCTWPLGRDERLPHAAPPNAAVAADRPWEYPRVDMSDRTKKIWHWGAFLGLPAVFIYLGLIVLMLRRVR